MLNAIIGFSIRNKMVIGLGLLLLIATGIYNLKRLPIDALPDITSNQVQVITISPALAAPEVERLITFPIEQACANIPGITELRSISRFGLSVLTIVFNDATDLYWARQQVMERLVLVREQIPTAAGNPELAPLTTGLGEVYQYFLKVQPGYENRYSLAELRSMQDWIVRRQLLGTPGVADVSSFGGHLKQYEVAIDMQRLQSMQVSVDELFAALEANNANTGGAYIEKGPTAQFIRTEGLAKSMEDIERIVVRQGAQGTPILVRDVAQVREGMALRYGALVYEDKGEVAGAVVLMLKGANANAVVKAVKARVEAIQPSLPEGVVIEPFYDRTKVVDRALNTVLLNLSEGALIVIFMLVLFLGNLRAGLIVASVIPLAMLFAISMMNVFGVSGNLMSLGALDFGLIVDGAVIIVEAVLHRLSPHVWTGADKKLTQAQMDAEVKGAAGKMMNAAVFAQIIILIVYLPILSLSGIEGKMFKPMAQTVSFALIGAFILSVTYVPAATALLLKKKAADKPNMADKAMERLRGWYKPLLEKALRRPAPIVLGALLLFGGSLWVLTRLGGEFIPELEEGDLALDTRLLSGTSLSHTVDMAGKVAGALKQAFPEVEKIVTRVGASEIPTDPMPMEMSDVIILLKPKEEWTSARTYDELADQMAEVLEDFPGLTAGFQFPIQMRFNELISGARQDVVCKLYGEDLDTLTAYAGKLGALMQGVDGVSDLYIETVTGLPQIQVLYNRDAMARYGVSVQTANRMVQASFAGAAAGTVYENERRYDLVVRLQGKERADIQDLQQLLIPAAGNVQVPLYLLADVALLEGPNQIQREDARRRIIVSFNVRGRDVESVVKDVQAKVQGRVRLPVGYSLHFGGAFENLQEAKDRLALAVPAALLLIFFLLFLAFGEPGPGLIIFSAIPMSAIGGILALWARDMPFSISAGIGFIALFGVSVLNGIVLLTEIRRLYRQQNLRLETSIVEGCLTRLRPVLMTAAVASFGFLPMALSQRAGAEVQRPLATVVIAGLITSTLLTLFVLPILYRWMEKTTLFGRKRKLAVLLPLLLLGLPEVQAQVPLTLAEALQIVEERHPEVAAALQEEQYRKALTGTARWMPKAAAETEIGQNEGPYVDMRISAMQGFQPMGLPGRQLALYQSGHRQAQVATSLTRLELARQVKLLYNTWNEARATAQTYAALDTLLARTVQLAILRLQRGETDRTELIQIELLQGQLSQAQMAATRRATAVEAQLGILLLAGGPVQPATLWQQEVRLPLALYDTALVARHPLVQLKESEAATAKLAVKVEQAYNHPEWMVGINSISVTGWQTMKDGVTERFYDIGNRFVSASVGVNFPLFAKGLKARVAAAEKQAQAVAAQVPVQQQQLSIAYAGLAEERRSLQQQLEYYLGQAQPRSRAMVATLQQRYQAGAVSYMEYALQVQQALQVDLQTVQLRSSIQQADIEIAFLQGKTESP